MVQAQHTHIYSSSLSSDGFEVLGLVSAVTAAGCADLEPADLESADLECADLESAALSFAPDHRHK